MSKKISSLSNLQQRIIVGLLGATLFIGGIAFGEWTYFLLFLGLTLLGILEFFKLVSAQEAVKPHRGIGVTLGAVIYISVFLVEKEMVAPELLYLMPPVLFMVFVLELFRKRPAPFTNIAFTVMGALYIAVPFGLLHLLAYSQGRYSWQPVLGLMFLIWASDTGAYIFGKNFGKHKLLPRVSPGKTWEGWAGGVLVAVGVAYLLAGFMSDLEQYQWVAIALIVSVFGVLGDLVESMLKRSLGVKDSGTLLPGHGGILDRFDSLILVVPFVVAFLKIF